MTRDVRLGDDIDDFCIRCKRVMNHAVVSVIGGVAAKVRCRTCHNDHDFRHELPPPPKVDSRKAALFNQVLKTVDPSAVVAAVELDPEPPELEAAELEAAEPEAVDLESIEEGADEPAAKAAVATERATDKTSKAASKSAAKGKPKAKK